MTPPLPTGPSAADTPRRFTRRSLGLLGAAAVGSAALPQLAAPRAQAATIGLRTVTANIQQRSEESAAQNLQRFKQGVSLAAERADVVFIQEVATGERREHLQSLAGWYLNFAGSNGLIMRRSRFTKSDQGNVQFADLNDLPKRNLLWMEATDRQSGLDYRFICTHTWSRIERGGRPNSAEERARVDDTAALIARLRDMSGAAAASGREVIVGGDFNIDWSADRQAGAAIFPWVHLEKRRTANPRLQSHYVAGKADQDTHGNRKIDYIYHWQRDGADRRRISQRSARTFFLPSDHRGVQAIFDTTVTT